MTRPPDAAPIPRSVAVFGGGDAPPGTPLYESARRIGRLVGSAGGTIVCGGYGGVMEGASRGARESGGRAIGVTVASFPGRTPNRWLTETREEADLFDRTRRLMTLPSAFIILAGRSGTLAEVALLWALRRADQGPRRPIVLLGSAWPDLIALLRDRDVLEPEVLSETAIAANEEDAVARALPGAPAP